MGSTSKERATKAMAAMSSMGFPRTKTKLVLKELLRTCENNWKHIEAENYRLLVEAILESEELEVEDPKKKKKNSDDSLHYKKKEGPLPEEPDPYRKRLRESKEEGRLLTSVQNADMSLRSFSPKENSTLQSFLRESTRTGARKESGSAKASVGEGSVGPLALYPDRQEKRVAVVAQQASSVSGKLKEHSLVTYQRNLICYKRPKRELGPGSSYEDPMVCNEDLEIEPYLDSMSGGAAPVAQDEQITGKPTLFEIPLAVILPPPSGSTIKEGPPSNHPERHCERVFPSMNSSTSELKSSAPAQVLNGENGEQSTSNIRNDNGTNHKPANTVESSSNATEIVSSATATGETKVVLSYSVVDCPNFQMPSLESVMKKVEDKCLKSYKILDSSFSLMSIMKEFCSTLLEMGTESAEHKQEDLLSIVPSPNPLKLASNLSAGISTSSASSPLPQCSGPVAMDGPKHIAQPNVKGKDTSEIDYAMKETNPHIPEPSGSLVLFQQHEPALGSIRPAHDANDITKGEERVRISIVNEVSKEQHPPHFSYIPHNVVYQNAYITFSLARIGDEDCCTKCFGDCLSASIPCACARETNGEYAYTPDGLLKKEFLDDCISLKRGSQKHQLFYCKDCPLERSKNEVKPDPCKGHLVRKFIKECWRKCGCNKQCGNRVVQRGITCNLQVFFTHEGKGWGLQALDDLPKGTFVCEYVGEVLTNMELYDRIIKTTGNAEHTYPVLLDADWGSEGVLKDEEALCLDATFYGNVARFINHRCGDASLVEVPVEVETPDHHYYHLAFFTTKKVEAFEELTWDYGIDFNDETHPVKAFRCCCGSKLCRDIKRRKRRWTEHLATHRNSYTCYCWEMMSFGSSMDLILEKFIQTGFHILQYYRLLHLLGSSFALGKDGLDYQVTAGS